MILDADDFGALFMSDLETFDLLSERSRWADEGGIGASDLGSCREKVRRTLVKATKTDAPNKWAALMGSYLDAGTKKARKAARPHLQHDLVLWVKFPNGLRIRCSLDELDADEPSYTDVKSKNGLDLVRRVQSDDQQRFQRHVCYFAAIQNGLVPPEGIVRNIYLDRSGTDPHPHVEQEPFDIDVVNAAAEWLSDVSYAVENDESAFKDWPRRMCQDYCQFYTSCRGADEIAEDYLTGHRALLLAEAVEAKQRRDEAEAVLAQARGVLIGTTGRSDTHWCRTTTVNAKTPYDKFECDALKEGAA